MNENETREKIAERFKTHFDHFGFKKTSVDDIAKELKISKKTIYQFFTSKEKIFYYVISNVARGIRKGMEKQLKAYPSHQKRLEVLIRMIFDKSRTWLHQNDAFEFKYKYEIAALAFKDAFSSLLKEIISKGMETGDFNEGPVDLKISFIQGIITEAMNLLTANPELAIEDEVISSVGKILQ